MILVVAEYKLSISLPRSLRRFRTLGALLNYLIGRTVTRRISLRVLHSLPVDAISQGRYPRLMHLPSATIGYQKVKFPKHCEREWPRSCGSIEGAVKDSRVLLDIPY